MNMCDDLLKLKYIDGILTEEESIQYENHLKECNTCLNEILELKLIETKMKKKIVIEKLPIIFLRIKSESEKIKEYFSSNIEPALVSEYTRDRIDSNDRLVFKINKIEISIKKTEEDKYSFTISNPEKKSILIKLKLLNEEKDMIIIKTNKSYEYIRNIEKNKYLLSIDKTDINLYLE